MDTIIAPKDFRADSLVGKAIQGFSRILYGFEGRIDTVDGPLELSFSTMKLRFDASPDGERLRVRRKPWLDPFAEPMTETNREFVAQHGRWRRVDVSAIEPYATMVGEKVTDSALLQSQFGTFSGLFLMTTSGSIWFSVDGDACTVEQVCPVGFKESRDGHIEFG